MEQGYTGLFSSFYLYLSLFYDVFLLLTLQTDRLTDRQAVITSPVNAAYKIVLDSKTCPLSLL